MNQHISTATRNRVLSQAQRPPSLRRIWQGLSVPVKTSLALQIAALPVVLIPGTWPWVLAWLLAQHVVLFLAGTVPRSRLLGPNRTRIGTAPQPPERRVAPHSNSLPPSIALTFDDGPDPVVTPQVLSILAERGVQASFFLIGQRALAHPELVQLIVDAGHRVENHTHTHSSWFCAFLPARLSDEITKTQRAIVAAGAPPPTHFRAPAGVRSPWLQPMLKHHGLQLTSWSRRGFDTSQVDPNRVLRRLTEHLETGEILLLHDGNAAVATTGQPMVLEVLPRLLDRIEWLGLRPRALRPAAEEAG